LNGRPVNINPGQDEEERQPLRSSRGSVPGREAQSMPDDDVARAVREDMSRWAVSFRRLAEDDPCCTAAGYLAAAKLLDRAAAEPVEALPGQRGTIDLRPGRPRRPGPYPPPRDDGA